MSQCELKWLDPAIKRTLPIVKQPFRQQAPAGFAVQLTAGKRSFHHGMFSLHHFGNAADIRTRTLPEGGVGGLSTKVANILRQALDARIGRGKYAVLRDDQGTRKPHILVLPDLWRSY